jgi:hypothetical protein
MAAPSGYVFVDPSQQNDVQRNNGLKQQNNTRRHRSNINFYDNNNRQYHGSWRRQNNSDQFNNRRHSSYVRRYCSLDDDRNYSYNKRRQHFNKHESQYQEIRRFQSINRQHKKMTVPIPVGPPNAKNLHNRPEIHKPYKGKNITHKPWQCLGCGQINQHKLLKCTVCKVPKRRLAPPKSASSIEEILFSKSALSVASCIPPAASSSSFSSASAPSSSSSPPSSTTAVLNCLDTKDEPIMWTKNQSSDSLLTTKLLQKKRSRKTENEKKEPTDKNIGKRLKVEHYCHDSKDEPIMWTKNQSSNSLLTTKLLSKKRGKKTENDKKEPTDKNIGKRPKVEQQDGSTPPTSNKKKLTDFSKTESSKTRETREKRKRKIVDNKKCKHVVSTSDSTFINPRDHEWDETQNYISILQKGRNKKNVHYKFQKVKNVGTNWCSVTYNGKTSQTDGVNAANISKYFKNTNISEHFMLKRYAAFLWLKEHTVDDDISIKEVSNEKDVDNVKATNDVHVATDARADAERAFAKTKTFTKEQSDADAKATAEVKATAHKATTENAAAEKCAAEKCAAEKCAAEKCAAEDILATNPKSAVRKAVTIAKADLNEETNENHIDLTSLDDASSTSNKANYVRNNNSNSSVATEWEMTAHGSLQSLYVHCPKEQQGTFIHTAIQKCLKSINEHFVQRSKNVISNENGPEVFVVSDNELSNYPCEPPHAREFSSSSSFTSSSSAPNNEENRLKPNIRSRGRLTHGRTRAPRLDCFEKEEERRERIRYRKEQHAKSIKEMKNRIEARNEKVLLSQQEILFAKAASELPPTSQDEFVRHASYSEVNEKLRNMSSQVKVAFVDLGLSPTQSTIHDVKRKFKELALKYHPDRSTKDTSAIFRRIIGARKTLENWFDNLD